MKRQLARAAGVQVVATILLTPGKTFTAPP